MEECQYLIQRAAQAVEVYLDEYLRRLRRLKGSRSQDAGGVKQRCSVLHCGRPGSSHLRQAPLKESADLWYASCIGLAVLC